MHVDKVVSRQADREYVSYLLRQSYREGPQVKKRTLANLSALPVPVIEAIRRTLAGEVLIPAAEALTIERSWPHGHVAATLGTARKLGLEALLDPQPSRQRDLVLAMVVGRILQPASKLATTRLLPTTSLGPLLDVEQATEDELYGAMDWLLARQEQIEQRLAKRYLKNGDVVLYDLSSTYVEGEHCPLAKRGYSRDGKPGKLQVEFGLLTNAEGAPLAIEAFAGNTADPRTFMGQVEKVKERFRVDEVVWVADRGMLTGAQLAKLQEVAGNHWVTALRAPTIKQLIEAGSIQLSLFDTQNLAEVTDPRYPGERLVVCFNPLLAEKRAKKREDMLAATEKELAKVAAMVERGAAGGRAGLTGSAAIGERVGRVVNKYEMAKHFPRVITDTSFTSTRDEESIAKEAALDGFYVLTRYPTGYPEGASRSVPSTTSPRGGCGRICSCACWPTSCSEPCNRLWPRCCSWTRRRRNGPTQSPRHQDPPRPSRRTRRSEPRTDTQCRASRRSWPTWPRWLRIA